MRTRYLLFAAALLAVALIGAGCVKQSSDKYQTFDSSEALIEDLLIRMPQISVKELQTKLENGEDFILIDVRALNEFNNGAIPGAQNIPRGVLEFQAEDKFPEKDAEIIVYCQRGARGVLAVEALQRIGYQNVRNLEGGWTAWKGKSFDDAVDEAQSADDGGGC